MWIKHLSTGTFLIGPFVDITDGATPETGLTIAQANVRLSKNGGSFSQKNESTSATHLENGWYSIPYNVIDTSTLGYLQVAVTMTGLALPVWANLIVIKEDNPVTVTGYTNVTGTVDANTVSTDDIDFSNTQKSSLNASTPASIVGSVGSVTNGYVSVTGTVSLVASDITLIAEEILKLDWTTVSGEAARSVLNSLRFLRNKWTIIGTTLSVKEEDDVTEAWSSVLTTDATADPVNSSDPN